MNKKLTPEEIKILIDKYNDAIVECFYPNQFTLNNELVEITEKIKELQNMCSHEFKDGYCVYCYRSEGDN